MPLFSSDYSGRISPIVYQPEYKCQEESQFESNISEIILSNGPQLYNTENIVNISESYRKSAYILNQEFRKRSNKSEGYSFNNFIVEGKVLYLLDENHVSISRDNLYKIKPEDIQLSHCVKFDHGLQFMALEGLSKLYSRGHVLSEDNIRSEMNITAINWNTFGKDIMELVQGVPNLFTSTPSKQKMIIMVGVPGSGKSTVANRLIKMNQNWIRVNQDELKTRKACEHVARDNLKKGKSIIVDRCNFDIQQRNVWIKLASEFSVTDIRCLYFKIPLNICKQRITVREDHPTIPKGDSGIQIIDSFSGLFVAPSIFEGFTQILAVENDEEIELAVSNLSPLPQKIEEKAQTTKIPRPVKAPPQEKAKTGNINPFSLLDEENN
jgi:predicted kinase